MKKSLWLFSQKKKASRYQNEMVNLRASRFATDTLPYDGSKEGWSLATKAGPVGPYSELKEDGQLTMQLQTSSTSGVWVDDSIGTSLKWLRSLPPDEYRTGAIRCLEVALFLLDDRAVERHGYSNSEEERSTPPDRSRLPTDKEWLKILNGLFF